jgi:hypothetical protein
MSPVDELAKENSNFLSTQDFDYLKKYIIRFKTNYNKILKFTKTKFEKFHRFKVQHFGFCVGFTWN